MTTLQANGLCKSFGGRPVVQDLDIAAESGEIVGLVGPNGAGKTTTLSMLVGRLAPDSGEIRLDGRPLLPETPKVRQEIGWVPQTVSVYPQLSARDNLSFFGGLYGLGGASLRRRIDEVLEILGLEESADRTAQTFSEGTKRRLNLALALVHRPKMLVLDEPTVGLDVHARVSFLEHLQQQRDAGVLIVYAGHYLEEAERLCDRLLLLDRGRLLDQGPLNRLLASKKSRVELILDCLAIDLPATLRDLTEGRVEESEGSCLLSLPSPSLDHPSQQLREVLSLLEGARIGIQRIQAKPPTLEEVVLEMSRDSRQKKANSGRS